MPVPRVPYHSLNGDSLVDIISGQTTSAGLLTLIWFENHGPGLGFAAHLIDAPIPPSRSPPAAFQIDRDGGPDIVFATTPYSWATSGSITWYRSTACPAGRYGVNGSIPCHDCAAGHVGPWVGLGAETGDMCAGPCAPGQYSAAGAMTCTNCSAGYMCGLAATSPTQAQCGPGTYSEAGAGVCSSCPGGRFGNSSGLTSSACTGPCPAGYVCGLGTVNGTATLCPPGQFSGEGMPAPVV
jgi:hypothetical protein